MATKNAINADSAGLVRYNGTGTFDAVTTTNHDVLVGAASNGITSVSPSTSGFVLTSNGVLADPSFQALPTSISTINGDTGSITGATVTIKANGATNGNDAGVGNLFVNSGTTSVLKLGDQVSTYNLFLGANAGNTASTTSPSANTGVGISSLHNINSGLRNTALGKASLYTMSSGSDNVGLGSDALQSATNSFNIGIGSSALVALTGGQQNTCIGHSATNQLGTGSYNVCVGKGAGSNYTSSESSNICIGTGTVGTAAESNVLRIGVSTGTGVGQVNSTYIQGIAGVTVANQAPVLINTSTGQLGSTATLPVSLGGTGASTLTGVLTGNGTSAITASAVTQHGVLLGGASNAVSSLGVAATGTVLTGVTGADPAFSATPTVTSISFGGTALANYVEGTFTPGIAFGGGTTGITYSTQIGQYSRIGNMVHFTIILVLSNKGSSSGAATLTGFPITASGNQAYIPIAQYANVTFTASYSTLLLQSTGTAFNIIQQSTTIGNTTISNTGFANNSDIRVTGFYFAT